MVFGRVAFYTPLFRVHRSNVSRLLLLGSSTKYDVGYPQTLALYYLIQTMGGDLGMALMSAIMRSVAKLRIRSSLGNSKATEQVSYMSSRS